MPLPTELQPLCREFDKEQPRVLVVVGAGVSFGATNEASASWRGLLESGVETLRSNGAWGDEKADANLTLIRNAFSVEFDLDEVLGRAESIAKALGAPDGPNYASWLQDAIGSLKARDGRTATLEAIKQLEQAGALILTTNYDNLLSDATGLDPVTWQDHRKFLEVLNRGREGVLHLHGHWRIPSSVILGRKSYEQIVATQELQDLFKSVWMHWSWVYVGCGNGLDDPNVGRLLRWGQTAFGESARPHYFLALNGAVAELSVRADKPANLVAVGYHDHSRLPLYLEELTPRRRPAPFEELGPTSSPIRLPSTSPLDIPLPSWEELLTGKVPSLAVDTTVSTALKSHGWALIRDVASVGKTTLTLRLAAASVLRGCPAFYLNLARVDAVDEDEATRIRAAARRLANTKALVIVDNAHWAPQIAHEVWEWWRERPRQGQLLFAATHIQTTAGVSGDDALAHIEQHPDNPAIALRISPEDLRLILNSVIKRLSDRDATLDPPHDVLLAWHAVFGKELGAFASAVTGLHHRLALGDWSLPRTAAAEWMRNRHLRRLDTATHHNAMCLAAFSVQELEVEVPEAALPHPDRVAALLKSGLAVRRERGRDRHRFYALREPDWGPLMLAALDPAPDLEGLQLEAAHRSVILALSLSHRLVKRRERHRLILLWRDLLSPEVTARTVGQLMALPLSYASRSVAAAFEADPALVDGLWQALAKDPDRLAERAFETPLHLLASFFERAAAHNRTTLVDGLWQALEKDPDRLAERAFETPLHFLASFLERAAAHNRTTLVDRLAERAFETPLSDLAAFFERAAAHNRTTQIDGLWQALEKDPDRLAERAFETPLGDLAAFFERAAAHNRTTLVDGLWQALEKDTDRLAERAFETPLHFLESFFEWAAAHNRTTLVDGLWQALEKDPDRLAERAFETPLHFLASFFERAAAHNRTTLIDGLWQALEKNPEKLQALAALASGVHLLGFLKRCPESVGRLAIAKLDRAEWHDGEKVARPFWGAPRLAASFGSMGREDLASTLRSQLLQTSDPAWFSAPYAALLDVALLLNTEPDAKRALIQAFVRGNCPERWLNKQYLGRTKDGLLAGALVLIATSQPPPITRMFWAPALRQRIANALADLGSAEGEALCEVVQFLGASQFVGQSLPRAPFNDARLDRIAHLPLEVLPHRPEVEGMEPFQINLWLGLRVVASLALRRLKVGQTVIDETLRRWRFSATCSQGIERPSLELAESMCAWLQSCSSDGRGVLLPSQEPLWRAAGFGHDPRYD